MKRDEFQEQATIAAMAALIPIVHGRLCGGIEAEVTVVANNAIEYALALADRLTFDEEETSE